MVHSVIHHLSFVLPLLKGNNPSGGSSYEATEAGPWPGLTCHFGKTQFVLRKRNQIRVSLYVSHNTR